MGARTRGRKTGGKEDKKAKQERQKAEAKRCYEARAANPSWTWSQVAEATGTQGDEHLAQYLASRYAREHPGLEWPITRATDAAKEALWQGWKNKYERGAGIEAIAQGAGVCRRTVWNALRKTGTEIRHSGHFQGLTHKERAGRARGAWKMAQDAKATWSGIAEACGYQKNVERCRDAVYRYAAAHGLANPPRREKEGRHDATSAKAYRLRAGPPELPWNDVAKQAGTTLSGSRLAREVKRWAIRKGNPWPPAGREGAEHPAGIARPKERPSRTRTRETRTKTAPQEAPRAAAQAAPKTPKQAAAQGTTPRERDFEPVKRKCASCGNEMLTTRERRMLCARCFHGGGEGTTIVYHRPTR